MHLDFFCFLVIALDQTWLIDLWLILPLEEPAAEWLADYGCVEIVDLTSLCPVFHGKRIQWTSFIYRDPKWRKILLAKLVARSTDANHWLPHRNGHTWSNTLSHWFWHQSCCETAVWARVWLKGGRDHANFGRSEWLYGQAEVAQVIITATVRLQICHQYTRGQPATDARQDWIRLQKVKSLCKTSVGILFYKVHCWALVTGWHILMAPLVV